MADTSESGTSRAPADLTTDGHDREVRQPLVTVGTADVPSTGVSTSRVPPDLPTEKGKQGSVFSAKQVQGVKQPPITADAGCLPPVEASVSKAPLDLPTEGDGRVAISPASNVHEVGCTPVTAGAVSHSLAETSSSEMSLSGEEVLFQLHALTRRILGALMTCASLPPDVVQCIDRLRSQRNHLSETEIGDLERLHATSSESVCLVSRLSSIDSEIVAMDEEERAAKRRRVDVQASVASRRSQVEVIKKRRADAYSKVTKLKELCRRIEAEIVQMDASVEQEENSIQKESEDASIALHISMDRRLSLELSRHELHSQVVRAAKYDPFIPLLRAMIRRLGDSLRS